MTSSVMNSPAPLSMYDRWRPGPPLLGLLAGWVALFSWSGMVAEASDFLMPTLWVGLLMALGSFMFPIANIAFDHIPAVIHLGRQVATAEARLIAALQPGKPVPAAEAAFSSQSCER